MMKRLFLLLIAVSILATVFADVEDDGVISVGEYDPGTVYWSISDPPLIVDGGGANYIRIQGNGKVEVHSTSSPINGNWNTGGILDIRVDDFAELLYLDGKTDLLTIDDDAVAILKGGSINYIRSYFDFMTTGHVDIYCKPGWTWQRDLQNEIVGITGVWENNNPFSIDFIDKENVDPVWMGVNVIEVPEPATMLLLTLGGWLACRKR